MRLLEGAALSVLVVEDGAKDAHGQSPDEGLKLLLLLVVHACFRTSIS